MALAWLMLSQSIMPSCIYHQQQVSCRSHREQSNPHMPLISHTFQLHSFLAQPTRTERLVHARDAASLHALHSGRGIFNVDGEEWWAARKAAARIFHTKMFRSGAYRTQHRVHEV